MYNEINGTLMGESLPYIFVYANDVTRGLFGLFFIVSFFLVVLMSSLMIQLKFTSKIKPEVSMLSSSFVTLGLAVILEQKTGILSPVYFFILIGVAILSFIWVIFSDRYG